MRGATKSCGCLMKVSIHARHYWRAMPHCDLPWPGAAAFQSTPAITGGRCRPWPLRRASGDVSIHARHYWRAMRRFAVLRSCAQHVSIHARHYWRAMPSALLPKVLQYDGFQSTPAITGGRCHGLPAHPRVTCRFNPRPPLLAGDASRWLTLAASSCCFNPRPPLLAGDAAQGRRLVSHRRSFNPRPPLLAGDATPGHGSYPQGQVSIHARHYWRAMPSTRCWTTKSGACFNPRPPLLAGDALPHPR